MNQRTANRKEVVAIRSAICLVHAYTPDVVIIVTGLILIRCFATITKSALG
jgi:hypothetical protein